jgi:hypothetical protein
MGRYDHRLGLEGGLANQFIVAAAAFFAPIQAHLLDVDVVLKRKVALGIANPDGAGWRLQGGQHALQILAIIIFGRKVLLRQPDDLFDESLDLSGLFGLLDC